MLRAMSLRIALFGQAAFGLDCLEGLLERGHEIVGVFAPPEASRPDPLAARAEELGLPLIRRRYFRKRDGSAIPAAVEAHRQLGAELNVLASVQVFVPREITDAPEHKSLCFHPSLLPAYRGGAAMQWQIIDGVKETGVSIFVPDEGADTGPVVVQKGGIALAATETTASLFFDKLHPLGVAAMLEAVDLVDAGRAEPQVQDESRASHQGLIDDAVAAVDLKRPAETIDRLVRGCDPQPGAFLAWRGAPLRLYGARLEALDPGAEPGTIVGFDPESGAMRIALSGGLLQVARVRGDAGKESARDWATRHGVTEGAALESGA